MSIFDAKTERKVIIWIAGILALAFIGLVYFEWGKGGTSINSLNYEIARVNGKSIYLPEFTNEYQRIKDLYYKEKSVSENQEQTDKEIMITALRSLIQKYLILQAAKKAKVSVSEEEIFRNIIRMKEFTTESGQFNEYFYKSMPNSIKRKLEEETKENLIQQLFQIRILDAVKVSDLDLRIYFQKRNTERKIRFVILRSEKKEQKDQLLPTLDEDRLKIEKQIDNFVNILKATKNFQYASQVSGLKIYETDYFHFFGPIKKVRSEERFNEIEIQDIYQKAFSLRKGEFSEKISLPDGYAVIQVIDSKEPDWNKFYYELPKIKAELENIYINYALNEWYISTIQNSKIVNNLERIMGSKK
jgi:hypothetical protein